MPAAEPFPLLHTGAEHARSVAAAATGTDSPRRRRISSAVGDDIRAGDTGSALATSRSHMQGSPELRGIKESPQSNTRRKSRKSRTALRRAVDFASRRTWAVPLAIMLTFLAAYAVNPTESNPVHWFIFLSYRIEPTTPGEPAQYGKGKWDIALVTFYTVVLTFTREFVMQELLRPLAKRAGMRTKLKQARFMEQAYTALYFAVLGPAGIYVMSRTPVWYFNVVGMYENFPHKTHEAVFKFYYLFQAAYWSQQAIVMLLGMEEPRKDFKELIGHHIVSLALIGLSYRFHFTYMGLAVYLTHDISDFFLATSKLINYIDHWIMAPYFFVFACVWIYLRHYLNLRILWSILNEFETVGPFELNWETQQYKCTLAQWITFSLLASLQALNLFWLFYILRIAYRFVVYKTADDDREEGEDEEEDVAEETQKEAKEEEEKPLLVEKIEQGEKPSFAEAVRENGNGNGHVKETEKVQNGVANGSVRKTRSKKA
ncbi:TLC domain-containing protein [Coniochaeta sp. 2T2.1]|nr:TLC domain-containing protein [Coniochaeta sp. 2T2.1]